MAGGSDRLANGYVSQVFAQGGEVDGQAIGLGHIVPLVLLLVAGLGGSVSLGVIAVAALATIAGLYLFEYAFVMAPQEVPNS